MARKTIEELKAEAREFIEDFKRQQGKSKLDPYREIIEMLRNEGLSYAKVAEFLNKRAGLKVSSSTVRMYVKESVEKDNEKDNDDNDEQNGEQTQSFYS